MYLHKKSWKLSNLSIAAIYAGGLSCGLYTTNSPLTTKYICETAPLDILVVQDIQMLEQMLEVEPEINQMVKKIILMEDSNSQRKSPACSENILSWAEVLEIGNEVQDTVLTDIENSQAVNQAQYIYQDSKLLEPEPVELN